MNLRQLECFLMVADELHFGRAAERLHLSPASVSEAIAGLEKAVGSRLFDRTSRRVSLTAHGRAFLADVSQPYAQLERAHTAALARARQRPHVRVAHTPELGQVLLPGLYAAGSRERDSALARWLPQLMHTPEQMRAVEERKVDLGLCWSVTAAPPLASIALREFPVVAVLSADDPLAQQPAVRLELLKSRTVLMTPCRDNPFIAGQMQTAFARAGLLTAEVREVARFDELPLQVAAARLVGLHPATIAVANRMPGVVFRPIEPALPVIACVILRDDNTDPTLSQLLDALHESAASIDLSAVYSWNSQP
ncbi:LysR family transcriptional regulator [Streptomyces sp. NPDC047081]|uniref:LysR family transcriptional regulator n=1 Tax=Streptomyces sp. NPDC047081 TaxID=3154706 RepID=UPI003401F4D4